MCRVFLTMRRSCTADWVSMTPQEPSRSHGLSISTSFPDSLLKYTLDIYSLEMIFVAVDRTTTLLAINIYSAQPRAPRMCAMNLLSLILESRTLASGANFFVSWFFSEHENYNYGYLHFHLVSEMNLNELQISVQQTNIYFILVF